MSCEKCEAFYQSKSKRVGYEVTPPCSKCLPEIHPSVYDAFKVYMLCHNQAIRAPMGGYIDLDFSAIWETIDRLGIQKKRSTFFLVLKAGRHMQKIWNAEIKRERDKKR